MFIISENNNFDCDSCGRRRMDSNMIMIEAGKETLSLCLDCANTLGIMLNEHFQDE